MTIKNPQDLLTKSYGVRPKINQVKDRGTQGKDLMKTIDKTAINDKPKVEEKELPVGETKVKDEKEKKYKPSN